MNKELLTSKRFIRRAVYLVLSVALLLLAGSGVINMDQADQWLVSSEKLLDTVLLLAASGGFGMAARHTGPGVDDPTTEADVAAAREQARREAVEDARRVVEGVATRAGEHIESVLAPYAGPTSR